MVLNGLTITWKSPAIFGNFNKNKKSLNPFIYKQSLRKLKGISDFLKSGAYDGTRTHDLRLTNIPISQSIFCSIFQNTAKILAKSLVFFHLLSILKFADTYRHLCSMFMKNAVYFGLSRTI